MRIRTNFSQILLLFSIEIPKFRWGSILQFSPVPPSLLMLQNTLRLRSRMIVNTTCQFLLKTSLLFQPFIRERCSSKRNEGNLSFRKCFRWQQRKLFHLFGKNTTATIKTRLIWRFQNPASSQQHATRMASLGYKGRRCCQLAPSRLRSWVTRPFSRLRC